MNYIIEDEVTGSVYYAIEEVRNKVLDELAVLSGSNPDYLQPLHWLNSAFNPNHTMEKAKQISGLGNFLMELEVICSYIEGEEDDGCTIKMVSHEEYLRVKKAYGKEFEIIIEGTCAHGLFENSDRRFDPENVYYVYIPTIEVVMEQSKNLGSTN